MSGARGIPAWLLAALLITALAACAGVPRAPGGPAGADIAAPLAPGVERLSVQGYATVRADGRTVLPGQPEIRLGRARPGAFGVFGGRVGRLAPAGREVRARRRSAARPGIARRWRSASRASPGASASASTKTDAPPTRSGFRERAAPSAPAQQAAAGLKPGRGGAGEARRGLRPGRRIGSARRRR